MNVNPHPTRNLLVDTTATFLATRDPSTISVDEILVTSGISKGSLYHHFQDLAELIEAAEIKQYADWVSKSIDTLTGVVAGVKSREELVEGLKAVTRATQSREVEPARIQRARTIAKALNNPRFKSALGVEQQRLTSALEDLFREAIERGWYRAELDPRACAILIQAYTLGKIVDDVVEDQMSQESWENLIGQLIERLFLN